MRQNTRLSFSILKQTNVYVEKKYVLNENNNSRQNYIQYHASESASDYYFFYTLKRFKSNKFAIFEKTILESAINYGFRD